MKKFAQVKYDNKIKFADFAKREYGFDIDSSTMFDTMIKLCTSTSARP